MVMEGRPVPVLHFSNSLTRGGAEEHILTLMRGLDRALFRLTLVCAEEVAEQLHPDMPEDVEVIPLRLRHAAHLAGALALARILWTRRVNILHSHLFYSSLFASPIGRLCQVPVILETPHCREDWRWRGKASFTVDQAAGRFVDYYIAVSGANARYLIGEKGLPARKVVVIPNGCDLARFDPMQAAPVGLKQSLGFEEDDPVLLVVGRLEPQKGHGVLIEALRAVHCEFPRARVVCLGEGSLQGELERRVGIRGLRESVRFVGHQSDVADWLAMADLTVLPSYCEGFPVAAIESLAMARPVVATAVDGIPEVVVDRETGLTVPPGHAGSLATAICRMLRDPGLRKRLGVAGRQWVEERFSQERQVQETQEFYVGALEECRRLPESPWQTAPEGGRSSLGGAAIGDSRTCVPKLHA